MDSSDSQNGSKAIGTVADTTADVKPIADSEAARNPALWNGWAGMDADTAYWAKVYYSNIATEEAQPLDHKWLDREPPVSPSDIPVFDWRLREYFGVGPDDSEYVPHQRFYVKEEDIRGWSATHPVFGTGVIKSYDDNSLLVKFGASRTLWLLRSSFCRYYRGSY